MKCKTPAFFGPFYTVGAGRASPSSPEGSGAPAPHSSHSRAMARLAVEALNPRRCRWPRSLVRNDVRSEDASRCASLRPARQAPSRSSMSRTASSAVSLSTPLPSSSRRTEAALLGLREERLSLQSEANSSSFHHPPVLKVIEDPVNDRRGEVAA